MRGGLWIALTLAALWMSPSLAQADSPSPYQALCDVEQQERDGSRCQTCQHERFNEAQQAANCGAAIELGYTERCAFGGMWVRAVYCDREADFIAVARGPREANSSEPADAEEPAATADTAEPNAASTVTAAGAEPNTASTVTSEAVPSEAVASDNVPAAPATPSESGEGRDTPASLQDRADAPSEGLWGSGGCSVGRAPRSGLPCAVLLLALGWIRRPRGGRLLAP